MPRLPIAAVLGLVLLAFAPAPALMAAQAAAPAAAASVVPPIVYQERTLPNGMKIYTSLDRTTPNVSVQVWYRVGAKDDPRGRSGFAHLFEHLMFKSTRDMPAEFMDRLTEDVGGSNNASTWDDLTNYYEIVPANHLERVLWAESERLSGLVIDEANFRSERDVVKEELRQSVLADPYGRLFSIYVPAQAFSVHPYSRSAIGSIEDLDAATLDDVRNFHATYYRPDNAALIVVGNFDEAQLNAWVDKYFGTIERPSAPIPRVTAVEPPRTGPTTFTGYGPNVPLPAVVITWPAPAASSPDAPALKVLDAILTSGKSSRLFNSLVYDQQIAVEIFSDADLREQPGMFYVGALMSEGESVDKGEAALLAQVAALRDRPVTAAELSEAKNELIASAVRERETVEGRADALGFAFILQGDAAKANTDIADLQRVTAADIQRVAKTYLRPDQRGVVRYLNESERPAATATAAPAATPPVASTPYTGPVAALRPESERQAPPPVGAPVQAQLPTPIERTLPNGLRVIVARSSNLPLVTADLVFRSGGANDPANLPGAMGMMAGLVTEGAGARSAQEIAMATEALGAQLSSGAGSEASWVSVNAMPDKLAAAMTIMADVARRPTFQQEEIDRIRSQTLDELSIALQRPGTVANYSVNPLLLAGTAYGHVMGGTPASLARITRDNLIALHQTYWRPDNAILILTGDITPEQGFALAERMFSSWSKPAASLPAQASAAVSNEPRAIAIDLPGTGQAAVLLTGPAIPRSDPRYYQALVTNAVLGGGYSARLNYEIRIKRGLSYGAGAGLIPRRSFGLWSASAQTKNESAAQVVALVQAELAGLVSRPPTQDELIARRSSLIGGFGRNLETTDGLANILEDLALAGVDLGEIRVYQERVEAVTPDQVRAYAADVLAPGKATIIVVGDAKTFLEALKAQVPNLQVVPAGRLDLERPDLTKPAP
ncbi:MAG: pitrilysin family protein [Caulobacteraceae bacterium]